MTESMGYLRVDQGDGSVLATSNNVSVKSTPCSGSDFGALGVEVIDGLRRDYFVTREPGSAIDVK